MRLLTNTPIHSLTNNTSARAIFSGSYFCVKYIPFIHYHNIVPTQVDKNSIVYTVQCTVKLP